MWMKFDIRSICICNVLALLILSCQLHAAQSDSVGSAHPRRIVSLAPGTTEILFALGLGDRVVGVSRYCDYPPSATTIPEVGGYFDPSYEKIVSLEPDLTILLTSHRAAKAELEKLGLQTLTTPHETVADVHEAIGLIGEACGAERAADSLSTQLSRRSETVQRAVAGRDRPRVLVCIGRDTESGQLAGLYLAGNDDFYDEIIELAGGVNAYENASVAYPQVSAEGVIQLDPDVIIDLVSDMIPGNKKPEEIERQWYQLPTVSAVRNRRVFVIVGNRALRPGPRYVEFLEHMAELLHPDAFDGSGTRE